MLKNNHGIPSVADFLIDPAGFNLKQIPGRSYEIFDPQFTEEKRQLAILLHVDTDVIYQHLLTVRRDAYDVIGEEYIFIRPYRGRSYSRRQINRRCRGRPSEGGLPCY